MLYEYINPLTGQSLGISDQPSGGIEMAGVTLLVVPYVPPEFQPMPSTAERINFLRDLKARILDITTGFNLSPTEVLQLAQTMTPITALVDIGADETLFYAISNLPADDPLINGALKDQILSELQAYIGKYKAFNP